MEAGPPVFTVDLGPLKRYISVSKSSTGMEDLPTPSRYLARLITKKGEVTMLRNSPCVVTV